jgi:hypothetical protein
MANVGVFDLQSERNRVRLIRGRRFRRIILLLLLYRVRVPARSTQWGECNIDESVFRSRDKRQKYADPVEYIIINL